MRLIRSVIRPSRFDEVRSALLEANVVAFTVHEVHDYAPQNRHNQVWRARWNNDNDPHMKDVAAWPVDWVLEAKIDKP